MRRAVLPALLALTASCAAPAPPPAPGDLEYARVLVGRPPGAEGPVVPGGEDRDASPAATVALPVRGREDEIRGLLVLPAEELDRLAAIAADDAALSKFLATPRTAEDLAALAYLRDPRVREARSRYEAARAAYRQSRDLADLVGLYRSFARDLDTRVGPEHSRRATGTIAPSPNVDGLSAATAERAADQAFEGLRAVVRGRVAEAWRAHADAAHLAHARRIVREEVELDGALLEVLRTRLEAGSGTQAGYLAFSMRLAKLRTELDILDRRADAVRAAFNRLLGRPDGAAVAIDLVAQDAASTPRTDDGAELVELALSEAQVLRRARLAAERAALAVRLAETMTLPRLDLGTSRFERERAGEAGAQRGPVFPEPGRLIMPRATFGVRDAQLGEMRARAEAAAASVAERGLAVAKSVRDTLHAVDAAARRVAIHETEVVPLAQRALETTRGAYEGNRAGYLDLLDAVRRLLDSRLALAGARRDVSHARADLMDAVGVRPSLRR